MKAPPPSCSRPVFERSRVLANGKDRVLVRNSAARNRAAKARVLLCVVALGTLLASVASAQYLEATIKLPDTLGPLNGPYHLAWDENPAHPRLYIGGESDSGWVIVAEAITCKRLARVSTGPVRALCFVPPHGKLYVASLDADSVVVVDCATNQATSAIHTAGVVPVMQYNGQNDRLYCGGEQISVIDCAVDSMVGTIPVATSAFGYDSASNKLYVGGSGPLAVIDCASDSVVASLSEVGSATALCLNPTARKVYAVTTDTLFAIWTDGDSVAARLPFDSLGPLLACDPQRNRIYCTWSRRDWGHWVSIDCSSDTVLLTRLTELPLTFLACNTARDMLYVFFRSWFDEVVMYDATTGQFLKSVRLDGIPPGGGWSPGLDRLYCLPMVYYEDLGYSCCLLSAVDGTRDSIVGVVPLTVKAENIVLDTVHNRLYFMYGSTACGCVGVVDCVQNVVTSYTYAGEYPDAMCYNPNNDRLYWGGASAWDSHGNSITVYDCSTGTVAGKVRTSGGVQATRLFLGLNKLYAFVRDSLSDYFINVIDCEHDSVIRAVNLPANQDFMELLPVPEDNRLWCVSIWSVVAIDCLGDSIVAAAPDTLGSINDACACPEGRRIYAGGATTNIRAVDMNKPAEVDTLHEPISYAVRVSFLNVPYLHKAYCSVAYPSHWPGSSHLFVIDTKTSTLIDSFWVGQMIAGMCLDHTGNFVYCASMSDSALLVIDARGDSVVATVRLPPTMEVKKNSLVLNRATCRLYEAQTDVYRYGDVIPVVRDSMLVGLEELASEKRALGIGPTAIRRGTPMRIWVASELWDAMGRRAAVLRVGLNDLSYLAPGVYFIRGPRTEDGGRDIAVQKVVIAK
jgi:YVTN family beta-propeller protein